jgi:hypothetical protein
MSFVARGERKSMESKLRLAHEEEEEELRESQEPGTLAHTQARAPRRQRFW